MSSAATPSTVARPSVFISYASEDRAAARILRDTLAAAGLEVWYDENELGGGDAWDQKIRRQIRECDYFMPLISAATERRKEGYFRREWRLAAERTLDMADDVLFLLPIVIDDTPDAGARVPDKFVAVQWLRLPGGASTPALAALMQRLLAGDHSAPPRPPLIGRLAGAAPGSAASQSLPPPAPAHEPPPPMPAFPHAPEQGGLGKWLKFCAEILWWFVTATWMLLVRLPKWLRVLLAIWVILTLLGPCRSTPAPQGGRPRGKDSAAQGAQNARDIEAAATEIGAAIEKSMKDGGSIDYARIAEELGRRFSKKGGVTASLAGKPLVLIPVARDRDNPAGSQFAQGAFAAGYAKLVVGHADSVAMSPVMPAITTDDAWVGVGKQLGVGLVLGLRVTKAEGGTGQLHARLLRSSDGTLAWSSEFPVVAGEAKAAGEKIAEALLAHLPKE